LPAGPLVLLHVFWDLFELGALIGAVSMVAALTGAWFVCIASAVVAAAALAGCVVTWMRLNRLD